MKTSSKTQSIAMIGMFTAVLAVLSILQIPMPSGVPITLQTFAVALCGYCLGKKNGTLCVALYLILGFVGVPVFTGMTAGIGKLFGYTGGFLYGFLFLAFFCGLGSQLKNHTVGVLVGVFRGTFDLPCTWCISLFCHCSNRFRTCVSAGIRTVSGKRYSVCHRCTGSGTGY